MKASTITTALSMMMPKSTAPREIRLAETPSEFIRMNATSSASGMTAATTSAAIQLGQEDHQYCKDQQGADDQIVHDRVDSV